MPGMHAEGVLRNAAMRRLTIQRGHPERDALALANDGLAHKIARRFHA